MPKEKEILQDCIEKLLIYGQGKGTEASDYSARALFVAERMNEALSENDVKRAECMVRDQVRLFAFGEIDPSFLKPNKELYRQHDDSPSIKQADSIDYSDQYYKILITILRRLTAANCTPDSEVSGVAITHRVWVGGPLKEDTITNIKSANYGLKQRWKKCSDKSGVKPKHYIWTNRQDLLIGVHQIPDTEFRDFEELFDIRDSLYSFYRSFVVNKEYAFASDLVRYQACYKYGGLFLGISWTNDHECPQRISFSPDANDFLVYSSAYYRPFPMPQLFPYPYHKQLFNYLKFEHGLSHVILTTCDIVDSELIYAGRPKHPAVHLVIDYQRQCLEALTRVKMPKVIKNYRLRMYHEIPKKMLEADFDKDNLKEYVNEHIRRDKEANIGLLTDVMPLEQALVDLGYYSMSPFKSKDPSYQHIVLERHHRFAIESMRRGIYTGCRALGLKRPASQSWLKVHLNRKPYSEV